MEDEEKKGTLTYTDSTSLHMGAFSLLLICSPEIVI
jgi:hypothetical protein